MSNSSRHLKQIEPSFELQVLLAKESVQHHANIDVLAMFGEVVELMLDLLRQLAHAVHRQRNRTTMLKESN